VRLTVIALGVFLPSLAFAYGEPDGAGRPNHRERLLHVFTNQVRQAPHDWPGWDTSKGASTALTPLTLHGRLIEAARFHADDMMINLCFQHESCDGTTFSARVARYFNGAGAGENIYMAQGDASERSAITGWMNSDGHRRNILTANWTDLGTGEAQRATGAIYYVQDFGLTIGAEIPLIPGAARELDGADIHLYATVFDAQGRTPQGVVAILDGLRIPLSAIAGRGGNLTYGASTTAPDHCAPVWFEATPASGPAVTFPTTGSLLVGSACTEEYTAMRTGVMDPSKPGPVVIDAAEEKGCSAIAVHDASPASLMALLGIVWLIRRRR
jgi:uncharacterized protein (TIGR03382 family)